MTFANYNKIINNELYLTTDGKSLGYTFRDALDEIAQATGSIVCLNENDEIEIRYPQQTNEVIDEEMLQAYNVEFGKKYGKVNLVPIAVNYFFMRDNRPEVWVEFGEEIILDTNRIDRKEYSEYLGKTLEQLCDKQMIEISRAKFDGYKTLFQQKLAWYRRIEQWLKRIEQ